MNGIRRCCLQYICDGGISVYNGVANVHGDHGIAKDFEGTSDGASSPYGGSGDVNPRGVGV